ncbi:MAG: prolyl aminopeptidase [Candidatus Melainabacteria bacterium]
METLYPPIEPFATHRLSVGDGHDLHVEEVGNPKGVPVVVLHGGPGGESWPSDRTFFDPAVYRIVLFDQRGCGKSRPDTSSPDALIANSPEALCADVETLRKLLGIDRWYVFGGSWGSTLALLYAEAHAQRVMGLILRGVFLCRPQEIAWLYQAGASLFYPDAWQLFVQPIEPNQRHNMVAAYHRIFTDGAREEQLDAAWAWANWEHTIANLYPQALPPDTPAFRQKALNLAKIENHFFHHCTLGTPGFLNPNPLLANAHQLQGIPIWIVQGRYDLVCPLQSAWDLFQVTPWAKFLLCPDAGHAANEPGILRTLLAVMEEIKSNPPA